MDTRVRMAAGRSLRRGKLSSVLVGEEVKGWTLPLFLIFMVAGENGVGKKRGNTNST